MDRRTFIKAAGVAGGAAWVAPAIVDSLASPAAAITGTPGCFKFTVPANTGACANATGALDATCDVTTTQCTTTTEAAGVALSKYCMAATTACAPSTATVTFSINAGCGCTILAARAETNANAGCGAGVTCVNGVIAAGAKSATFTKPGTGACQWVGFNFIVRCT
jgi:hypothetical protein